MLAADMKKRINKIKVMLIISNLEFGGAQRQLVELANNLSRDDFDVMVCSLSQYIPLGSGLDLPDEKVIIIQKKSKYDISVVFRLSKVLRENKVDVLHAFLFDAEIAARIASAMAGVAVMIGSERNSDYRIKRNQMVAYRLTKNLRDVCIANSKAGADFNAQELGYPEKHYAVVRNGVDTNRFRAGNGAQLRETLGISQDQFVIGMFASFKEQKNHGMLFHAVKDLTSSDRNFRVVLLGEELHGGAQGTTTYVQRIHELVDRLGIRDYCLFVGNQDNIEAYYRICDVTVLPSKFEGTPNVVLESMASGVPVIVTAVSDNNEIVEHGKSGYVVDVGDEAGLSRYLQLLMEDRELSANMGSEARRRAVELFSSAQLASSTGEVYKTALEQRSES